MTTLLEYFLVNWERAFALGPYQADFRGLSWYNNVHIHRKEYSYNTLSFPFRRIVSSPFQTPLYLVLDNNKIRLLLVPRIRGIEMFNENRQEGYHPVAHVSLLSKLLFNACKWEDHESHKVEGAFPIRTSTHLIWPGQL